MSEFEPSTSKTKQDVGLTTEHSQLEVRQLSAGELIQQAREAAGLNLVALSALLKVPVKKLEDLEAGRLDSSPDAVFVRALASSVCRYLQLDAAIVLERLPRTSVPTLTYRGTGINAPFRQAGGGAGLSLWSGVSRPAMLSGAVLLFAALALIMLPSLENSVNSVFSTKAGAASAVNATHAVDKPGGTQLANTPEKSQTPSPVLNSAVLPTASLPILTLASTPPADAAIPAPPLLNPPAFAASGVAVQGVALAVPGSGATAGIVVFNAKNESWVEVTDSRGTVVLRRILAAGESVGVSGFLPLSAIVGRADATQVQIRGRAFDLAPLTRDNVARFEVK